VPRRRFPVPEQGILVPKSPETVPKNGTWEQLAMPTCSGGRVAPVVRPNDIHVFASRSPARMEPPYGFVDDTVNRSVSAAVGWLMPASLHQCRAGQVQPVPERPGRLRSRLVGYGDLGLHTCRPSCWENWAVLRELLRVGDAGKRRELAGRVREEAGSVRKVREVVKGGSGGGQGGLP
jgi:hypothetical protein